MKQTFLVALAGFALAVGSATAGNQAVSVGGATSSTVVVQSTFTTPSVSPSVSVTQGSEPGTVVVNGQTVSAGADPGTIVVDGVTMTTPTSGVILSYISAFWN